MDSFNYGDHNVEMEEANSMARDNRLRSMGKSFRTIELCIALLWVMLRLPFAVRIFGELLPRLIHLRVPPITIAVLFGVYFIAMVKSYRVSTQNTDEVNDDGTNFFDNILYVGDFHEAVGFHHLQEVEALPYEVGAEVEEALKMKNMPLYEEVDDEVVYEDKEIVMSYKYDRDKPKTPSAGTFDIPNEVETDLDPHSDMGHELELDKVEVTGTVEENSMEPDVVLEKQYYSSPKDRLDEADFKKTIEAFIKRQHEFLKRENRREYYGEADAYVYCY